MSYVFSDGGAVLLKTAIHGERAEVRIRAAVLLSELAHSTRPTDALKVLRQARYEEPTRPLEQKAATILLDLHKHAPAGPRSGRRLLGETVMSTGFVFSDAGVAFLKTSVHGKSADVRTRAESLFL